MKKIILSLSIIILSALSLISCETDNYMLYDTTSINKLYFQHDTVKFVYGPKPDKDVDISVPVKLIGFANLDADASFVVEIDEARSTAKNGIHYTFAEEVRIMKDSTVAYVNINIDKKNLIKDISYKLYLRIRENDSYAPTNKVKCYVEFGNTSIPQPEWWKPDKLGVYTQEKLVLFIEYFTATKSSKPKIYDAIVYGWGPYLEEPCNGNNRFQHLLTTAVYVTYFKEEMYWPMYEYYVASGYNPLYEIPNPLK